MVKYLNTGLFCFQSSRNPMQLEIEFGWEIPLGKQILRIPRRGEKTSSNMELRNVGCEAGNRM